LIREIPCKFLSFSLVCTFFFSLKKNVCMIFLCGVFLQSFDFFFKLFF
jgi:hypothetical protein